MLEWEYSITVPSGVILTDETVDAFIQGFHPDGTAKERSTANGTYPSETSWVDSRYAVPESESFGTKRIPGTDPFYFYNQEAEDGKVYARFGHLEPKE